MVKYNIYSIASRKMKYIQTATDPDGIMMLSVETFDDMVEQILTGDQEMLKIYRKNILNGLKGGTYIVNIGLDKNDTMKLKTGWQMIEKNVGRISDLVMDLLSYSKEREPEYQNCAPNEIARDVCDLMESKATEHHVEIKKSLDQSIGEVSMDPKKDTQKPAKSAIAIDKESKGFTEEERAAMKERAQELKAEARRGKRAKPSCLRISETAAGLRRWLDSSRASLMS